MASFAPRRYAGLVNEHEVTRILCAARDGSDHALEELLPVVYTQLHGLARRQLRRERDGHTLQATALVNEAYLRLVAERERNWENRAHFMTVAATAMRRVLVNHAEKRRAQKRGGDRERIALDEALDVLAERAADVLALDEALDRLAAFDPQKGRIVELRFYGGLTIEETAHVLGVSTRTVERGWRLAKAWLRSEVTDD